MKLSSSSFFILCQITSRILRINPAKIHIVETATDKVPNTSATAASCGSDLNGMAVMVCNNILYITYANKYRLNCRN